METKVTEAVSALETLIHQIGVLKEEVNSLRTVNKELKASNDALRSALENREKEDEDIVELKNKLDYYKEKSKALSNMLDCSEKRQCELSTAYNELKRQNEILLSGVVERAMKNVSVEMKIDFNDESDS